MKRLDGQVAVVTGASSGIGRRLAVELAGRGATVVGVARRAELLAELEAELRPVAPGSATAVCDVGDVEAYRAVLAGEEERRGRIDVLVNCAAVEVPSGVGVADVDVYRRTFEVNFFAAVAGTLQVVPGMRDRRGGVVVNVSSDSARAPTAGIPAYASSKAALSAFSESLFHELYDAGVRVHVLYPGWVPTPMGLAAVERGMPMPPKIVRRTPDQIAALVLDQMGGDRVELNAARVATLTSLARAFVPGVYRRMVASRS